MSAVNMMLKIICLLVLTTFFRWYRQFYKHMPMHRLSLTHMVNYDLAAHYYLINVSYCICSFLIEFEFKLGHFAAHIIVAVFVFFIYGMAMYCTITVVIQYLHVHYRQTSISGVLTDIEAQRLILVMTSAIGLVLQSCRMLLGDRIALFNMIVREPKANTSPFGPIILTLLLITALATNIVLRVVMRNEKVAMDLRLGYTSAKRHSPSSHALMKYLMMAVMFFLLSLTYLILHVTFQPDEVYYVADWYINVQLSVSLPLLCTCSHRPLRQFIVKKFKQTYKLTAN